MRERVYFFFIYALLLIIILLSASRVRSAWLNHMHTSAPISETCFLGVARPLISLIESAAARLSTIVAVNRAVHTQTYNRLIAEVAAEMAGLG